MLRRISPSQSFHCAGVRSSRIMPIFTTPVRFNHDKISSNESEVITEQQQSHQQYGLAFASYFTPSSVLRTSTTYRALRSFYKDPWRYASNNNNSNSGGGGNNSGGGSGSGSNNNNDNEDNDLSEEEVYLTVRNLIVRFAIASAVLYYLSLPKGTHISLDEIARINDMAAMMKESGEMQSAPLHFTHAYVYNTYVQWYDDDSFLSYHYTAIPNVEHFDKLIAPIVAEKHNRMLKISYKYTSWSEWGVSAASIAVWIVPLFFIPVVISAFTRPIIPTSLTGGSKGGGNAKVNDVKKSMTFTPTFSNLTFKDVIGMQEAKQEIQEFIEFLGNPAKFAKLGAQIPNGALLLGPPGVGKTLLAKAVAGEAKASFIACCGSDFVELYAGMGALRVRKLFESAQKHSPCIIYIDEIDAIGMKRTGDVRGGGQEREHTLNQLLAQLDGFSKKHNVITIASTNAPISYLDPALVRPGRLDRIVNIDRPLIRERSELFEFYLNKINLIPIRLYKDKADPDLFQQEEDVKAKMMDARDAACKAIVAVPVVEAPSATSDSTEMPTTSVKEGDQTPPPYVITTWTNNKRRNHNAAGASSPGSGETFNNDADPAPRPIRNDTWIVQDYAKRLSQLCPGFTGADIRNVCNEAAILAARSSMTFVDIFCLEKAVDRVLAGIEKRAQVLSDFEKKVVAHHEAGHAVVGWLLERADPLMKVSIVPRGGKALGYAQYLPSENRIQTEKEMFDDLCVCLGGRAAEWVFFKHLSTGAQDDLSKVRSISYSLVSLYGRIPELQGVSHMPPGQGDSVYSKPYSDSVAQIIDIECKKIVDKAYAKCLELLTTNKVKAEEIAQYLLKNEVLTRDDVIRILGPRPFKQEGFEEVPIVSEMPSDHPMAMPHPA